MRKLDGTEIVYVVQSENGVETRRTDKSVAEQDADIIRTILHRWCEVVEEIQSESGLVRRVL